MRSFLQCPDFTDYPTYERYDGPYATPDLNASPDVRRFRTVIQKSYRAKPDFAGRFEVLSWGCGSNCHVFALVDTKTGKIAFFPVAAALGARYRLDSRLFVIDPPEMVKADGSNLYETACYVWDDTRETLRLLDECSNCLTGETYASTFLKDINGDENAERFRYALRKKGRDYEGLLQISDSAGAVLWSHEWEMRKEDLEGDLLKEEGNISVTAWVEHFFDGIYAYGAGLQRYKIEASEINDAYIRFHAAKYQIASQQIRKEILVQSENVVFTYRASWREDYLRLVYIPSLSAFIAFSGGAY